MADMIVKKNHFGIYLSKYQLRKANCFCHFVEGAEIDQYWQALWPVRALFFATHLVKQFPSNIWHKFSSFILDSTQWTRTLRRDWQHSNYSGANYQMHHISDVRICFFSFAESTFYFFSTLTDQLHSSHFKYNCSLTACLLLSIKDSSQMLSSFRCGWIRTPFLSSEPELTPPRPPQSGTEMRGCESAEEPCSPQP